MNNQPGIYEILNTMNGKRYIGSAVNPAGRKRQHWHLLRQNRHHSAHLQNAWNKYGDAAFQFKVLLDCECVELIPYEKAAFEHFRPEYNVAPVAGSQLGMKHTAASRAKMSATRTGLPMTQAQLDTLARMTEINRHRVRAPHETAHLKGNTFAHAGLGKKRSAETKARMSLAQLGNKGGSGKKGKKYGPQRPEHIAARAEGMRAYYARKREAEQATT